MSSSTATGHAWSRPSSWMKRRFYILTPVFLLMLFLVMIPHPSMQQFRDQHSDRLVATYNSLVGHGTNPREKAANATLGFEKILAVSIEPSWRTRGLSAAAAYTGLEIEIPIQPQNPPELIDAFERMGTEQAGSTQPKPGSATAWMAHLDMLKYVIARGWESALIIEDDVDWDLQLFDQMRLVSDNVRAFTEADEDDHEPYGSNWDVLWLGHCGEVSDKNYIKLLQYEDPTRPTTEQYGGWSKRYLRELIPDGSRIVQEVHNPVCSFGYGVTKASAQKVLTYLSKGNDEAFDVALQHHCTRGNLRCLSVNPEIMHHYEPDHNHGYISQVKQGDSGSVSAGEEEYEHIKGSTANIVHSARCKALFDDTCLSPPWELKE